MIVARKNERGQAIVLMVLALVVLLGMAALVLDVGNWFHTKRRLQATSDAAALAGAQKLPEDPSGAAALAMSYANQKGPRRAAAGRAARCADGRVLRPYPHPQLQQGQHP